MLDGASMLAEGPASTDAADAPVPCPVAAPSKARVRDRSRERVRYRPGSRLAVKLIGRRKERMAFLDLLARHGDPAIAADTLGLPLLVLYRYRDADPAFAAEWQAAVGYAWEQVESRVLAALLAQLDGEPSATHGGKAATGKGNGLIDSRLALAILNGRDRPVTRQGGRAMDSAGMARLRAELRALAGTASTPGAG